MHDTDIFSAVSSEYIIITRRSYIITRIFSIAIVTKELSLHIISTIFSIVWLPWCCSSSPKRWQSDRVVFPPGEKKGITDKSSNIMVEFRWWRWWIWWCNDLPWKGVEYNRKMNIKAHRLSPRPWNLIQGHLHFKSFLKCMSKMLLPFLTVKKVCPNKCTQCRFQGDESNNWKWSNH